MECTKCKFMQRSQGRMARCPEHDGEASKASEEFRRAIDEAWKKAHG